MFDKLIESDTTGAQFKPRRTYFMVSSVVVGILFVTAVVISLYAQDIDIGDPDFDMSVLVAQVSPNEPEPPMPRDAAPQQNRSERPTRQANIARIDETQPAPDSISTVQNTRRARPIGNYSMDRYDFDPPSGGSHTREMSGNGEIGSSSSAGETESSTTERMPEPPPVKRPVEIKKPVSKGVINGIALYLPKPPYPPAARAINVSGDVNVQVLIDESGDVVSAKAVGGPALLRLEAERAAARAKFKPTYLSDVPVKVTGIIVYKFSRS